jgi:hypothetical protein
MSEVASCFRAETDQCWEEGDCPLILKGTVPFFPLGQEERRGALRYSCIWDASCATLSTYERIAAAVRDLSQTGIGLFLDTEIEAGAYLVIDVKRGSSTLVTLVARAVRSAKLADGKSFVGCRLTTPLTEERVQVVLGCLPETRRQLFSWGELPNTFPSDALTMPY